MQVKVSDSVALRGTSRARRLARRVVAGGLGLVALVCVAFGILVWRASEQVLHPPTVSYAALMSRYRTLDGVEVSFRSRTQVTIFGRFFPGRTHATIILSHGYGAQQEQMLPWALFLH